MAVDDLWFSSRRQHGPDGKLLPPQPTQRHGRGKRWRVRSPGLPALAFDKKADAERADAARRADLLRGTYIDPTLGQETVAQYAQRWRETQVHRPSTAESAERAFRLHINPRLGRLRLADVRFSTVQSWVKSLDMAPATVHVVFAMLNSMFGTAVRDRAIASNPCTGVRLPDIDRQDTPILTPAQVHGIAEALPARYRALVYVGAGCGLRISEALALELRHLDFLRRELRVEQQLTVVTGRQPYLAPPKTKTSTRTVELPQVAAEALARHLQEFPAQPVELDDETGRKATTRAAELVFTNQAGRPIQRARWAQIWRPAADAAGAPAGTGFHALRHYFATLLIFGGANVKTVQLALGHATPTMTLNVYAGLWPDQVDRTRALVDGALGSPTWATGSD